MVRPVTGWFGRRTSCKRFQMMEVDAAEIEDLAFLDPRCHWPWIANALVESAEIFIIIAHHPEAPPCESSSRYSQWLARYRSSKSIFVCDRISFQRGP